MNHLTTLLTAALLVTGTFVTPVALAVPQAGTNESATSISNQAPETASTLNVERIKRKAAQGNARKQNLLGAMYMTGYEVKKDYSKAYHWFKLGSRNGNSEAQINLAVMFANGYFVAKDIKKAKSLLDAAKKSGNKRAGLVAEEYFGG